MQITANTKDIQLYFKGKMIVYNKTFQPLPYNNNIYF